ncbi:MAG: hypothetical protein L6U99_11010 [Clostridium sp.]|nr:MAG: hypothetical protein L6U99_11010 [Clostridium sp.]
MNKKRTGLQLFLDDSLKDEEVFELIKESYELTK